jgi:predicted MPP superfamily phosphohydrolase
MSDILTKLIMLLCIVIFDAVLYFLLIRSFPALKTKRLRYISWIYLAISLFVFLCFWFLDWLFMEIKLQANRSIVAFIIFNLGVKLMLFVFLVLDNGLILVQSVYYKWRRAQDNHKIEASAGPGISRKQFLVKATLMSASVPLLIKGFNIINQAYNYQVRRVRVTLPNLPKAFHGLKIGQISDIHSGSYDKDSAVGGGVELLMQERADLIFFTGDLVNRTTDEVHDYFKVFQKVRAPLGVYSVLGNHDYGDYASWPSAQAKQQDFQNMLAAHQELGWTLLRNQNQLIREGGETLAILGVENWGVKRFSKYGKIEDAYAGTEEAASRLLLSHDPSHWEAKVLDYPDIDITFSGHTHGFQFGVEAGNFRWSPSQYLYKQWAGLYQKGTQYIYVNRGYGYIGLPGRVGITPEVTIIELARA